jgi:predicted unusual protein kinase regulating ubiquinone biosynthesis (AarF/ABC1/UbiB family)
MGTPLRLAVSVVVPLGFWLILLRLRGAGGEGRNAEELRDVICRAGAMLLKLGQAASSRPDLVTGVYREELLRLVDDVPGFDGAVAEVVVVEKLTLRGKWGISATFRVLKREATAAAILGQVHRAVLVSGAEMAVIVLRPGVREQAGLDLFLLREGAAFARSSCGVTRWGIVDEFGKRLREELESWWLVRNAEHNKGLYVGRVEGVYVPKAYRELTTRQVLVIKWVDGDKPAWPPN